MSGFSSLNVAARALAAQQRALDVTGQNIANAGTPGYTRQRVELQSVATNSAYGLYAKEDSLGNGVSADKVIRVRDAFLERRAQQETGTAARTTAVANAYDGIETTLGEPGTAGLQKLMASASASWSSLASDPTNTTRRTAVLAASQAVASGLNTVSASLDAQWTNTRTTIDDTLAEVNATLSSVADLNRAIAAGAAIGQPSNELMDQRDALVGTLAVAIGATAVDRGDGTVDVVVGGSTIVGGSGATRLTLGGAAVPGAMGTTPVVVSLVGSTHPLPVGGSVGGQLTAVNSVIPGVRTALDGVAAGIATGTNTALAGGFDQSGAAGAPLFAGTTAATISVIISDPAKLAAAGSGPAGTDASTDGKVADAIAQLATKAGGPDALYRGVITDLGVRSRTATAAVASANAVVTQVEASRLSVSGVSLDEEMTNMLMFKQSYAAAARVVTAIDEMLDVLINKTGLVGR